MTKTVTGAFYTIAGKDSFFGIVFEGYILIPSDGGQGSYFS